MTVTAYHFTGKKLRDGRRVPRIGEWLVYEGKVVMCLSGLHASREPFDALRYAPGPFLHRVECDEIQDEGDDKLVCRRRKIVDTIDATDLLRYFARMQALSVVHLWDAPNVVLDYLMTGDESLRIATRAGARAAAPDTARAATWAARAATWDAELTAGTAALDAALDTAWAAARYATWAAARAAARAAQDAAREAAWEAARDAALEAREAAWEAARKDFNALVYETFEYRKSA